MPTLSVPAAQVEGKPPLTPGLYQFQCKGFKAKYSKKGDSVNLNPIFEVINHPTENGSRIFENGNTIAGWVNIDWFHAMGVDLQKQPSGDYDYPIEFSDTSNPGIETATVTSPCIGMVGSVYLATDPAPIAKGATKPSQYICVIPGCTTKHSTNLLA